MERDVEQLPGLDSFSPLEKLGRYIPADDACAFKKCCKKYKKKGRHCKKCPKL